MAQIQAVVKLGDQEYGVGILNNKICMYNKTCYGRDHCHMRGSVLRMDTNTLEKYEVTIERRQVNEVPREDYKRLGTIIISSDEVQQIKTYVEQMLKLYGEGKYNDMAALYLTTVEYENNVIDKYVTMLEKAYRNLGGAILLLIDKRRGEQREKYNLNIRTMPRMTEMWVYNLKYGVSMFTNNIYIWRAERSLLDFRYITREEIQIELDTGVMRFMGSTWLHEDEVLVLKGYAEQLADHMERYDYNAVADTFNKAAQYVRGLIT